MRYLPLILTAALLCSCASTAPAIRQYKPITVVDKQGRTYQKMALATELTVDMPSLAKLDVGNDIHLTFNNRIMTATTPVYDSKGNVTGSTTSEYAGGVYVSHVVDAQGNAVYKCINAGAAAATGILVSIGSAVVTSGATALIPK